MGCIYMRISPSGGKYVGQTIQAETTRWKQHIYSAFDVNNESYYSLLNCAIRKYGGENFSVIILEDNIPNELLDEKEIYWINFYKTYFEDNQHGYNMSRGGAGPKKYSTEYFLKYWNEGKTLAEISNITGVRADIIGKYLKPYIKLEDKKERMAIKNSEAHSKIILQYSLNGELIKEWPSLISIAKEYNSSSTVLIKQINSTRFFKGSLWCYKSEELNGEEIKKIYLNKKKTRNCKPILQYDLKNNFIQEWSSAKEAGEKLNISSANICKALKKVRPTYKNYIWKYKGE